MSRPTVPTCDECGAQKKETNHWWVLVRTVATVQLWPHDVLQKEYGEGCFDLCSEQCVTRAIGKWMRGELK